MALNHAGSRAASGGSRWLCDKTAKSWHDRVVLQFFLFASVGATGTLVQYTVLLALVVLLQLDPVFASGCGYLAGGVVNYMLNYRFTFRSQQPHRRSAIKFFLIAAIGFGINLALMSVAIAGMRLHFIVAQVFSTAAVLGWNFIGNRLWTFRNLQS